MVKATLREPGEAVLAEGSVELEIREDWVWRVDIFLTDEPGDSLFIVWGGNWISDPVVY